MDYHERMIEVHNDLFEVDYADRCVLLDVILQAMRITRAAKRGHEFSGEFVQSLVDDLRIALERLEKKWGNED